MGYRHTHDGQRVVFDSEAGVRDYMERLPGIHNEQVVDQMWKMQQQINQLQKDLVKSVTLGHMPHRFCFKSEAMGDRVFTAEFANTIIPSYVVSWEELRGSIGMIPGHDVLISADMLKEWAVDSVITIIDADAR